MTRPTVLPQLSNLSIRVVAPEVDRVAVQAMQHAVLRRTFSLGWPISTNLLFRADPQFTGLVSRELVS